MKIISLLFSTVFIFSCSIKENVINNETGKIVAGYSKRAPLRIGQPFECNQAKQSAGIKEGLVPDCLQETGKSSILKLVYIGNPKYSTSKGIVLGDSINKVIKIYGKPKATYLDYGIKNMVHWEWRGLFYDHLTFFMDSSFTKVSSICLGDKFLLDKKYIKEYKKQ